MAAAALAPWLPGHQQPRNWPCKIISLSSMANDFNHLHQLSAKKSQKMQIYFYSPPNSVSGVQKLTHCSLVMTYSIRALLGHYLFKLWLVAYWALSHYHNQGWLVNLDLKITFWWNSIHNSFRKCIWNYVYKILAILLTHWGRVMHICVSNLAIIGSDNGLSPGQPQAIIWTSAGILSIGPLGTNFSEIFF